MSPFKAIVTGGAGFIGSHIAEGLINEGCCVTVIDNLSTGRMSNIAHLPQNKQLQFIEGSVTDRQLLQKAFKGGEVVFHQAAIPSVPRSISDPISIHEANATGTLNVLATAKDEGIKKVIYASSSSVYGDSPALPKREDMTTNPLSPYAVSKLTGEHYCCVFNQVYGLAIACLRYFNVYGPRQDPNSEYAAVIPRFISAVLAGKPPIIYGDGEKTRDFTFVQDVVTANIMASNNDATGVFNIGGGQRIDITDLAHLIIKLMGREDIRPIYENERTGDIKHSLADITKSKTFGYSPSFSLSDGLQLTIRESVNES